MNYDHDTLLRFACSSLKSDPDNDESSGMFPENLWSNCGDAGILDWACPCEFGGRGLSAKQVCENMETLGTGCSNNGLLFALGTQIWGIQKALIRFGNNTQISQHIPELIKGAAIGAHAINESTSGSDALNLDTFAVKNGDSYILTGEKTYIALADQAAFFIVYAVTNQKLGNWGISAFLVDRNARGVTIRPTGSMMGLRSAPLATITFTNCIVSADARLGKEGAGASLFNYVQTWERSLLQAPLIGSMQRQLEKCIEFTRSHKRGGGSIAKYQSVSNRIAEMAMRVNTSRVVQRDAARRLDDDIMDPGFAAMTKIQISEAFERNSRDALALLGASGFIANNEQERNLHDAIGSSIYGGTTDVLKNVISSHLGIR